jgi:hypothetical protein
MTAYHDVSSAVFDRVLAPFGHAHAAFDLLLWPVLMGVAALGVYKLVSNQKALARVKSRISMRLLEIRLFRHDIAQVLRSTGTIVLQNASYLRQHLTPMAVMFVPMMAVVVQLVANYAYAPSPPGAVETLRLALDPDSAVTPSDVTLSLPSGVALDAPPVRTADGRVFWRLRADEPGDHVLGVRVAGETYEKGWAVGGEPRKIPVKRLRSPEALLYPGEAPIPRGAPVLALELDPHVRELARLPDGEGGIVLWALGLSLLAGFALRGVFGVTF